MKTYLIIMESKNFLPRYEKILWLQPTVQGKILKNNCTKR